MEKKIGIRLCVGQAHAKADAWINFHKKIKYSVGQKPTHKEDEKKNLFFVLASLICKQETTSKSHSQKLVSFTPYAKYQNNSNS